MKRWLVAVMVLINGATWWWLDTQRASRLAPPPPGVHAPAAAASAPKLLLLREVAPEPGARPATAAAAPGSDAKPGGPEASAVGEFADRHAPAVRTPDPDPIPWAADPEPARFPESATAVASANCFLLGGADRRSLLDWRDALRAAGMQVAEMIQATEQEVSAGYRVHLPAGDDPQKDIEALGKAGIDVLLVVEPNAHPRMSAGVFGVHANALRRQQQLAELGYAAEVVSLRHQTTTFWTQVTGPPGSGDRAAGLLNSEYRDAKPFWRPCATTAAPAISPKDVDVPGGQD